MQFEKGQQFIQQSTFASNYFLDAGEKRGGTMQKYFKSLWKTYNNQQCLLRGIILSMIDMKNNVQSFLSFIFMIWMSGPFIWDIIRVDIGK